MQRYRFIFPPMMGPKCWFLISLFIIIQVITHCNTSPLPWNKQDDLKTAKNQKTNSGQEDDTESFLSRNKRGIDDVRLLIDLERSSLLRDDKRTGSLNNVENLEAIRAILRNGNDLKRLRNEPSSDQYRKVIVEKNNTSSGDLKKFTEQIGLLNSLDLPNDIKRRIVNEYLGKAFGKVDKSSLLVEVADKDKSPITKDTKTVHKNDQKDEFNGKRLEIISSKNIQPPYVVPDETLSRDLLRKRMVRDFLTDGQNNIETAPKDEVISKTTPESTKPNDNVDEITDEKTNDDSKNSETNDKSFVVVIDLTDRTVKAREVPKLARNQIDRKTNKTKNDIRIKIKQEINHEHDPESNNNAELKIIIKLPDNSVDKKDMKPENISAKTIKDDIADEINSMALTLLKKIEYDTSNYDTKELIEDIKEDIKELAMSLLRKLDEDDDTSPYTTNNKLGQEKVKREVDQTQDTDLNWELTYHDTHVKSDNVDSMAEENDFDNINGHDAAGYDEIDLDDLDEFFFDDYDDYDLQ